MISADLRDRLRSLSWGNGLTRDQIRDQWPDFPSDVYNQLPPEFPFHDASSIVSYLQHVASHDIVKGEPPVGEPPRAWGPSPTGRTVHMPPSDHGVGSGTDPGNTGSSAHTGDSRRGVDYGGPGIRD